MPPENPSRSEPAPDPAADVDPESWSGVHRGPLRAGEWVRLTDTKGRRHNIRLEPGRTFFTNRGAIEHDDLIGRPEGLAITSSAGGEYLVFRPLLNEFVVSMPRGAAVVYPKDAAQIVAMADIFPGARVVEAGVGSGALTCSLLRAVGPHGTVSSYERRQEFADVAEKNVTQLFGGRHPAWRLTVGDFVEALDDTDVDRVVLDMLAPWECIARVADALTPGGWSAPTSPPPRSSAGRSRPSAPTAGSPSRVRGRRSCGTGTSRASRSGPGTRCRGTPGSWSPPAGWRRGRPPPPRSGARRQGRTAWTTRARARPDSGPVKWI